MTTVSKKIQIGAAAFVVAGATLISPVVSHADNTDNVGSSAGQKAPARAGRGAANRPGTAANAATPDTTAAAPGANATAGATANALGANPLFQNPLIWIGTPNPNPPTPPLVTRTFEPLASLPGFTQPFFGWYRDLNFEACVLGVGNSTTTSVGPYGTSTSSVTAGC